MNDFPGRKQIVAFIESHGVQCYFHDKKNTLIQLAREIRQHKTKYRDRRKP